jgi:hypothetical protein
LGGLRYFRFYPLRGPKTGFPAGFWPWILPQAKSIYPPKADSNGNSGILPPPFGRNPASLPALPTRCSVGHV